jgi:NADH dehydrogenase [ubiquinone] 1 alpha subcomplex assembly factor 5
VVADHDIFDRRLLTSRRNRAARNAAAHQFLLEQVADDILTRLGALNRKFPVALNLGAHHGLLGRRLRQVPGVEMVIDADPAALLLAQCEGPRVQADEEFLPFADRSLDLVVSGLALHLTNDLPGTLVQIRRALKPDGLLLAAALGGGTLHELRHSLLVAEEESERGVSPRVAPFADIQSLGALLQRARFALPVADSETVTVTYPDPLALMHELRAMGASNMLRGRRRSPMRRATLLRAVACYRETFALPNGRVPATFEIITLTAWAPTENDNRDDRFVAAARSRAGVPR